VLSAANCGLNVKDVPNLPMTTVVTWQHFDRDDDYDYDYRKMCNRLSTPQIYRCDSWNSDWLIRTCVITQTQNKKKHGVPLIKCA